MQNVVDQRTIVVILHYLKVTLRENGRSKISDERLAELLGTHMVDDAISATYLNDLINFRVWPNEGFITKLRDAALSLARARDVNSGLEGSRWAETLESYVPKLPEAFRRMATAPVKRGIPLGHLSSVLHGAWRFYYVSPVNREGAFHPEVRGTLCIFGKATVADTEIPCEIFSGHARWRGTAFANETHLYLVCSAQDQTETASFLVNRPQVNRQSFAGLGLALQRSTEFGFEALPPAIAVLTFGEKIQITPENSSLTAIENDPQRTLRSLVNGGPLSATEENDLRKQFSIRYSSLDILMNSQPNLRQYIRSGKLNGEPMSMAWLHLAWN